MFVSYILLTNIVFVFRRKRSICSLTVKNANLVNNSQGVSLGTNYETSIVKPVFYGDASQFGFKQEPFVNPMNQGTEMHFLKKIDEQLNKSK